MTSRAAARRQRIHQIRVTVAGVALAVFIALFATIYVQMAAGRDPVLATRVAIATTARTAPAASAATTTATPTTTTTTPAPAAPAAPAATATPAVTAPAPVTTAQS
jgi:hypothetical protein